jgi:ribonuclease P protein component
VKKIYRLKKSYEIAKVIHQKMSVGNRYYAIYYQKNDLNLPKVAISVSKRFGDAVHRNYAKRVVREIIRPMLGKLTSISLVIIIKDESKKLGYNDKRKTLEKLINKIVNKINQNEEIK